MKIINMLTAAIALATATPVPAQEQIIGKNQITLTSDRLTPEALWAMGRIGSMTVSPDNKQIVYTVSYYSVKQNKSQLKTIQIRLSHFLRNPFTETVR